MNLLPSRLTPQNCCERKKTLQQKTQAKQAQLSHLDKKPIEKSYEKVEIKKQPAKESVALEQQVAVSQKSVVLEPQLVSDLAERLDVPVNELILTLLKSGIVAPKNKILPEDIIETIARHYEAQIIKPIKKQQERRQELVFDVKKQQERPPIVVVMGHTKCGAVTAACHNVELGNITTLLHKIKPVNK